MKEFSEVVEVLALGYPYGDISEKIMEVLKFVSPTIAEVAQRESQKTLSETWQKIKKNKEIQQKFGEALTKADRTTIIYVSSKFENNEWVGTNIIKSSLAAWVRE